MSYCRRWPPADLERSHDLDGSRGPGDASTIPGSRTPGGNCHHTSTHPYIHTPSARLAPLMTYEQCGNCNNQQNEHPVSGCDIFLFLFLCLFFFQRHEPGREIEPVAVAGARILKVLNFAKRSERDPIVPECRRQHDPGVQGARREVPAARALPRGSGRTRSEACKTLWIREGRPTDDTANPPTPPPRAGREGRRGRTHTNEHYRNQGRRLHEKQDLTFRARTAFPTPDKTTQGHPPESALIPPQGHIFGPGGRTILFSNWNLCCVEKAHNSETRPRMQAPA